MLAKETDTPFNDKDWVFEIKWDGYRALAEIEKGEVKLYSRKGNSFNELYPSVVKELEKISAEAILDGEIVVTDEEGKPDFQLLQNYSNSIGQLHYYVFDLLSLNGHNTCGLKLLERKELLKKLLPKNNVVHYSNHIVEKGIDFFRESRKINLEGILAKKSDSEYHPGVRTQEWMKIKHHRTVDVIIAGFTQPTGTRKYFGALVLAIRKGNSLKYVGHTGTGFNNTTLREVNELLETLIQEESPFQETIQTNTPATWVKPLLVCEIKFSEWTQDGKMRSPVFMRLRPDKPIKDVNMANTKIVTKKTVEKTSEKDEKIYSFGKTKVKVTHPDKIFWPDEKITKSDVVKYYLSISDYILPYLKNRPQSLKRNPNGILDKGFFHKDAGDEAPPWVKSKKIFSESANKDIDYIICNDKATLTYLNNLGCIELNPWHSTVTMLDKPDYLIIDIDPSEKNSFEEVIEAANVIHELLEKAKAENFCKTSGATGLHVYVPLNKKYTYDQARDFANLICMLTNEQLPAFTSLERNLEKRGKKMYLDYLQNRRGQTISSVYSLRPHPGATVSTPLKWKEVKIGLYPDKFNIHTTLNRLTKMGDIFSGVLGNGINLEKCLSLLKI